MHEGEEVKARTFQGKAFRIITELMNTLNHEVGGEIASNLHRLYTFMLHHLSEGNLRKNPQHFDEVARLLSLFCHSGQRKRIMELHQGSLLQEGAAMSVPRAPKPTVGFVDQYCAYYHEVFPEVGSVEQFKYLHLGLIAELPRKTLPAIARVVGLEDEQSLHHFLANSPWEITQLRDKRLQLVKQVVRGRSLVLCIDETGDKKKGKTTDYVARQYIGIWARLTMGLSPLMRMAS